MFRFLFEEYISLRIVWCPHVLLCCISKVGRPMYETNPNMYVATRTPQLAMSYRLITQKSLTP